MDNAILYITTHLNDSQDFFYKNVCCAKTVINVLSYHETFLHTVMVKQL